nr:response regulator transcription factor [Chloroflexota bacterium]
MRRRPRALPGAATTLAGSARPEARHVGAAPVTVLIVDHTDFVRQGIASILADVPEVAVVGVAATAGEAIELGLRLRPEVILMDGNLPERGGYEATRRFAADCRSAAVIILSAFEDAEHALEAFACGANGYLSKEVNRTELVAAIHRAAAGETSVDPVLGARLLQALAAKPAIVAVRPDVLTPRELDVLQLLA